MLRQVRLLWMSYITVVLDKMSLSEGNIMYIWPLQKHEQNILYNIKS